MKPSSCCVRTDRILVLVGVVIVAMASSSNAGPATSAPATSAPAKPAAAGKPAPTKSAPAPAKPASSGPAKPAPKAGPGPTTKPAVHPSPAPATVEQVLEQLGRVDAKVLNERLAKARARAKTLTDETGPLKTKVASHEAELPRLALKAQLLEAVVKARGTSPTPPAGGPKSEGQVDAVLDQLAGTDPKAMSDLLTRMQARLKTVRDELAAMKPKIASNDTELAKLSGEIDLLDALVKAKQSMSGGAPKQPAAASKMPEPAAPKAAAPAPPGPQKKAEGPSGKPAMAAMNTQAPAGKAAPDAPTAPRVTFAEHILPIVSARCLGCHNPDKAKGGLVLENYASAMAGGSSGAVIVPGAPDRSRLFKLVSHLEEPYMPPLESKLDDAKIELIRRWIEDGAPADAHSKTAVSAKTTAPSAKPTVVARSPDADGGVLPTRLAKTPVRRPANPMPATALAVSPVAPLMALAGDEQILYYGTEKGELLGVLEFPEGRVEHLGFNRDGTLLIAAGGRPGQSGTVAVFEVESGRRVGQFDRLYDTVLAAAISADNSLIAVGGTNRKVRVFDLYTGSRMFEITAHNDWILDVQFSPDSGAPGLLATADRSGGLYCWEADTGREVLQLRGHVGAVTSVAFRQDGQVLASVGADGTVRLWELEAGHQIREWGAHQGAVLCITTAADQRMATSGADGLVKLWRADGGLIRAFDNQGDWVYRVSFTPDGLHLVSGAWSGAVRIFDVQSGKATLGVASTPG